MSGVADGAGVTGVAVPAGVADGATDFEPDAALEAGSRGTGVAVGVAVGEAEADGAGTEALGEGDAFSGSTLDTATVEVVWVWDVSWWGAAQPARTITQAAAIDGKRIGVVTFAPTGPVSCMRRECMCRKAGGHASDAQYRRSPF